VPVFEDSKTDLRTGRASGRRKKEEVLTFGCAVILLLSLSAVGLCSASGGLIEVGIGSARVEQNAAATLPVTIHNATDLGSIDLELTFDPAIVTVTSITAGEFDTTVTNLEETANGFVKIVAFQAANPSLNGTIVLAQVTLGAVGAVDSTTPLNITVNRMTDATPLCRNLSYALTNGSFTVIPTAEPTPAPTATPSAENGGGGQLFSVSVDSDGDGYSDHYERLTGSNPYNPCDPDPNCSACWAPQEELLPVVATPSASPRSTPVPSRTPSTPVPTIEPAPPSAVPQPKPVLEVHKPPESLMVILIAAITLSGLLLVVVSRRWRKLR
jgi:hypothetical protein